MNAKFIDEDKGFHDRKVERKRCLISNNKAPNIECLLGEFYKDLCSSIKNVYMHLLDECLQNKKLPLFMHTNVITFIY
jgi:hypothetical protein